MKHPLRLAAIVVLAIVPLAVRGSAQAPASLPSIELPPALARVLTDYEMAWGKKDAAALAALFAEDGFVLSSGVPPVRGRAAIQQHYAKAGGPLSLRALASATSGDVGYIIGAFAMQKGGPDAGKFTLTLKKDAAGRWLIMSDMDNGNSRPGQGSAAGADALPRAAPESVGFAPDRLRLATEMLSKFVADGKIAGAVAGVARKGKLAYLEAAGFQDLETRAPMTPRSLFRIYSMTKPVTAVAVMMLQEEGKFSLTDPVSKYLPELSARQRLRFGRDRADSPRGARDHRRGSAAPHLGAQPSHLASVRARRGAIARDHAPEIHREHHPRAADGGSAHALPLQRSHHRARAARRDLVGQTVRRVPAGAAARPAEDVRHGLLGRARAASRLTRVYADDAEWVDAERAGSGAVHGEAGADRRRGRSRLDGSRLPPLQPDAAEQGRARRRASAQARDRREDDRQRPLARDAGGARPARAGAWPTSTSRPTASTDGTAAPAPSSGSIRPKNW